MTARLHQVATLTSGEGEGGAALVVVQLPVIQSNLNHVQAGNAGVGELLQGVAGAVCGAGQVGGYSDQNSSFDGGEMGSQGKVRPPAFLTGGP